MNHKGQASIEAAHSILFLGLGLLTFLLFLGVGWLRFEFGQLVQKLGACLSSTSPPMICQREFRRSVQALPGGWQVHDIIDGRTHTRVKLKFRLRQWQMEWKIDEPKVFSFER